MAEGLAIRIATPRNTNQKRGHASHVAALRTARNELT